MAAAKRPGNRSAVRQPVFLDVVAVGFEQHIGAAMFADRFGRPLDHAVALAGLLVFHLAGRGDLEALFGARFGLQLGHMALLIGARDSPRSRNMLISRIWPGAVCSGLSVNRGHGSPYWPGSDGGRYGRGGPPMQPPAFARSDDARMPARHPDPEQRAARFRGFWRLARRQDHDHLAAFEFRLLLDLRYWADIILHTVKQFGAQLLVRHFAAAKTQGDFDLVAVLEEALHRAHFHLIIVVIDHRTEFDLLDLDDFLLFAGFRRLLLRLVLVLAIVQDLADWRRRVGGDFDQVEPRRLRHI